MGRESVFYVSTPDVDQITAISEFVDSNLIGRLFWPVGRVSASKRHIFGNYLMYNIG